MAENKLILGYWALRGRAQPIRTLLEYLHVPYEEKQYVGAQFQEWFAKDKLNLGIPLPNLPYLIDGDFKLSETSAISYYIIKKSKRIDLVGQNADGSFNEKEFRVIQVIGVLQDFQRDLSGLLWNPEFNKIKDSYFQEKLEVTFKRILGYLGQKNYLADTLSLADFAFYEQLQYIKHIYPQQINDQLKAYLNRFEGLDGVKDYIHSERCFQKEFLPKGKAAWFGPE